MIDLFEIISNNINIKFQLKNIFYYKEKCCVVKRQGFISDEVKPLKSAIDIIHVIPIE